MDLNQPLAFRITGELMAQLPAPVVPNPVTSAPTPPFSLLLVGLKQDDTQQIKFCGLDISACGPEDLDGCLHGLIQSCELVATDVDRIDIQINKKVMHWGQTAGVAGVLWTTDLADIPGYKAPDVEFDILRLAAGRGMGDVLMVEYALV